MIIVSRDIIYVLYLVSLLLSMIESFLTIMLVIWTYSYILIYIFLLRKCTIDIPILHSRDIGIRLLNFLVQRWSLSHLKLQSPQDFPSLRAAAWLPCGVRGNFLSVSLILLPISLFYSRISSFFSTSTCSMTTCCLLDSSNFLSSIQLRLKLGCMVCSLLQHLLLPGTQLLQQLLLVILKPLLQLVSQISIHQLSTISEIFSLTSDMIKTCLFSSSSF